MNVRFIFKEDINMLKRSIVPVILVIALFLSFSAFASPTSTINFQGRILKSDNSAVTGTQSVTFKLWDKLAGGTDATDAVWTETDSVNFDSAGVFNVVLGNVTPMSGIDFSKQYWIEVALGSETFSPRQQLCVVPYAFYAVTAGNAGGSGGTSGTTGLLQVVGSAEIGDANCLASGTNSLAVGYSSTSSGGGGSVAMGYKTIASGGHSVAIGGFTTASGSYSTAMGGSSNASGNQATAMGGTTSAGGACSTSMGVDTIAGGDVSVAMGGHSSTGSYCDVAIGQYNVGGGSSATSWSGSDPVFEIGNGASSTAKSNALTVLKNGSVGIGTATPNVTLQVIGSAEIGNVGCLASGVNSVAMGTSTTASGNSSTAMGTLTTANGSGSTAIGNGTSAGACISFAIGNYNVGGGDPVNWKSTDPLFEVGNGSWNFGSPIRSDALTILKNGNIGIGTATPTSSLEVSGNVKVDGGSVVLNATSAPANPVAGQIYFSNGTIPHFYGCIVGGATPTWKQLDD